jgi:hypothetical protein
VESLGAEGPSAATVARPNGDALEGMRLVMGGGQRLRHGFAIALLDARLSFENAEKECPASGGPGAGDLRRGLRVLTRALDLA